MKRTNLVELFSEELRKIQVLQPLRKELHVELLGVFLAGARMLVAAERRRPDTAGDRVLLRGDSEPSVACIRRCAFALRTIFG